MKKTIRSSVMLVLAIAFIGSISSCRKDVLGCTYSTAANYNLHATLEDGTCRYNGSATFWYDGPRSDATVHIDGLVGYITQYYPVALPACGSAGCANFTLEAGTYSYHVESSTSTWDGTMTVNANECSLILLN